MSTAEVSWAEGALEAASSSESSELMLLGGMSDMMRRGGGRAVDSGAESVTRCFSSVADPQPDWIFVWSVLGQVWWFEWSNEGNQVLVCPTWGFQELALRDGLRLVGGARSLHYWPSHWCTS